MLPVSLQLHAFAVVALSGVGLGLLFDLWRVGRWAVRPRGRAAAAADLVLGLAAATLFSAGLYAANWGEFRLYDLVAAALGMALYFFLASRTVLWAAERIARRVLAPLRRLAGFARRASAGARRLARGLLPRRRFLSRLARAPMRLLRFLSFRRGRRG